MAIGSDTTLHKTPLYDRHVAAGAKLVPFAGWEMPVQYAGIKEEHLAVRTKAGVFDVSHMGEIETTGPQAQAFLQRILSNDVACKQTALDFSRDAKDRLLFASIEPDVLPGSPESDARIRRQIVYLHERILGRHDAPDSPEVDRTFRLFSNIVADAASRSGLAKTETYTCRQNLFKPLPDPHYTVRAWRGVVTYLLRRTEFLYE